MAQYPDVQELGGDVLFDVVRNDKIPCMRPHVVFISCKILAASVFERGDANAAWVWPNEVACPGELLSR